MVFLTLGCHRLAGPPGRQEGRRHQAARRGNQGASLPPRDRRWRRALPAKSHPPHGHQKGAAEKQSKAFYQGQSTFRILVSPSRDHALFAVKTVNYSHLFPTRYALELESLKGAVAAETFKEPTQRENARKNIKKLLEERYQSGKNKWFFQPLRVSNIVATTVLISDSRLSRSSDGIIYLVRVITQNYMYPSCLYMTYDLHMHLLLSSSSRTPLKVRGVECGIHYTH